MPRHVAAPDRGSPRRSRWAAWRRLSPHERRDFLRAAVLIPLIATSLRIVGLKMTLAWTTRRRTRHRAAADEQSVVRMAVAAIRRAEAHGLYAGTCLSRSLALRRLLLRDRVDSTLRFGAGQRDGRFEAHAWVELHGVPINETDAVIDRLTAFDAVPATASSARVRQGGPPR